MLNLAEFHKNATAYYQGALQQMAVDCPKMASTLEPVITKLNENLKKGTPVFVKEDKDGYLVELDHDALIEVAKTQQEQLLTIVKEEMTQEDRERPIKKLMLKEDV